MIPENEIKEGQIRLLDVDNPLVVPEGKKIKFIDGFKYLIAMIKYKF